ncbi:MAG: hypothetical protein SNJ29_11175 [Rikenellaceae bacterium]
MKRDNLFLKYWYLWLLVLLLPLGLYWIISRPCGFDAIGAEKAPEIWLGFWGGYLGAVIAAIVTFIILRRQLDANAKQNDKNRNDNEKQNEKNRQLQLNQLQYQQAMANLANLKSAFVRFSSSLDYDSLSGNYELCFDFMTLDKVTSSSKLNVAMLRNGVKDAYLHLNLSFDRESCDRTVIDKAVNAIKDEFVGMCDKFIQNTSKHSLSVSQCIKDKDTLDNAITEYIQKEQQRINNILLK